jgi:hypothetical protein
MTDNRCGSSPPPGGRGLVFSLIFAAVAASAGCGEALSWPPRSDDTDSNGSGGSGDSDRDGSSGGLGGSTGEGIHPGGTGGAGGSPGTTGTGGSPGTTGTQPDEPIAGVASIWGIHDGEKIARDDLDNPHESANTAWDGATIRLFGARNEVLAFQVVIESDAQGVQGLDVKLPELKHEGGAAISYSPPGDDPSEYVGRPIQIFTENYMYVEEPSQAGWRFKPGGSATPPDPTGWKPVQLVPENAKPGLGGLPIDIAPANNQAIWIEVYAASHLPAGTYTGHVQVTAGGATRHIPVELTLFDFTLPDENSLDVMIYFESEQVSSYVGTGEELNRRFHRLAHRHRVEFVEEYGLSYLQNSIARFDGSDFAPGEGYEGPGEGVGYRILPASMYGPPSAYQTKSGAWGASDKWMTYLNANIPDAITFLYMPDEPGSGQFDDIQEMASYVHDNPGPGGQLPVFVTSSYKGGLDGAIDIWCAPTMSYDIDTAAEQRAEGHEYWFYNGHRPDAGALIIESPATDPRANPWIAFKHGVDLYFFWHANHWEHNSQKPGDKIQNVWANPVTFDNRGQPGKPLSGQGFVNGDGVLVYPGRELHHPEEDRGIAGPISSIQLANLRRGAQDHLYLTMARDLGLDDVVESALSSLVPAVLSDAEGTIGFSEHGDDYEAARRTIAEAIAAASK